MKKYFMIVLFIITIFTLYNLYLRAGEKYHACENGIFYTYPPNTMDASSNYYNRFGIKIAQCDSWISNEKCKEIQKTAGKCD